MLITHTVKPPGDSPLKQHKNASDLNVKTELFWGLHSPLDLLLLPLTLDTVGQSQSPLHTSADGLKAFLELLITVMLLFTTGVIAAVMLVTTFGHGRDAYVKLEKTSLIVFVTQFIPLSLLHIR